MSAIFDVLELLRNGCIISGSTESTHAYRASCSEQAYYKMCTDVVPALVAQGTIPTEQRLENVCDIAAMAQKHLIRPAE